MGTMFLKRYLWIHWEQYLAVIFKLPKLLTQAATCHTEGKAEAQGFWRGGLFYPFPHEQLQAAGSEQENIH